MKILFVCNHRGGANALYPFLQNLKKKNYLIISTSLNKKFFLKFKKNTLIINHKITNKEISKIYLKFKPNIVISGTSEIIEKKYGPIEQKFINHAKLNKIYSIAIMDFWSNYKIRFSLNNTKRKIIVPDKICVIDSLMKKEMIAEGFNKENIYLSGSPHLEYIYRNKFNNIKILNSLEKKSLKINNNSKIILFISQPIYERNKLKFGYTEFSALNDLLESVNLAKDKNIKIIIKMHPSDKINKYYDIIKKFKFIDIRTLSSGFDILSISRNAYAVIGLFSMLLIELSMINSNIYSYQPTVKKHKLNVSNRVTLISQKKKLIEIFIKKIKKNELKKIKFSAIEKINKLIISYK